MVGSCQSYSKGGKDQTGGRLQVILIGNHKVRRMVFFGLGFSPVPCSCGQGRSFCPIRFCGQGQSVFPECESCIECGVFPSPNAYRRYRGDEIFSFQRCSFLKKIRRNPIPGNPSSFSSLKEMSYQGLYQNSSSCQIPFEVHTISQVI